MEYLYNINYYQIFIISLKEYYFLLNMTFLSVKENLFHVQNKSDTSTLRLHKENNRYSSNSLDSSCSRSGTMANDLQLLRNNNIKEAKVVLEKMPIKSCTKLPSKPPVDRSNKPNFDKKSSDAISILQKDFIEVQRSLLQHGKVEPDGWSREQRDTLRKTKHELVKFPRYISLLFLLM
jgi:hypothetical protein